MLLSRDTVKAAHVVLRQLEEAWPDRPHSASDASACAMRGRLRVENREAPHPTLPVRCGLCEAQFANTEAFDEHMACIHGGRQVYCDVFAGLSELRPIMVAPVEMRRLVENTSTCIHHATMEPSLAPFEPRPPFATQCTTLWRNVSSVLSGEPPPGPGAPDVAPSGGTASTGMAETALRG